MEQIQYHQLMYPGPKTFFFFFREEFPFADISLNALSLEMPLILNAVIDLLLV